MNLNCFKGQQKTIEEILDERLGLKILMYFNLFQSLFNR